MPNVTQTYESPMDRTDVGSLDDLPDRVLLKWVREGSTAAFETLFARYETRLVGYASRYFDSVDLAKDVCQEVFLKLITKPPRVLMSDSLAPWLFRVARNLAIDSKRRRKFEVREAELRMHEPRDQGRDPLQSMTRKSDVECMQQLVRKLPPELRDVVELRIYGDVAFKEIAGILRIPQGTALWRMHRAVGLLRQAWKRDEQQM